MPLILHIDTATENATISIAQNEHVIGFLTSINQKDHASFLQPGIRKLFAESNISINQLNAVSVTAGPGSYTGLRVGMASAKGICYALQIPLITLSTLEVMVLSIIEKTADPASYLYCPMIDAGRMEVFTALFDENLRELMPPCALILQPGSFDDFIKNRPIIFCGNGAEKFLKLSTHSNLLYVETVNSASALSLLSLKNFKPGGFADLLNAQPAYLKQFYTPASLKT